MFRVRSACTAFPLKGNVIQTAEREGLLEGRFFMLHMKEMHTFIYTSDLTFRSMTNWVTSLINHAHLLAGGFSGCVSTCAAVGAPCMHPRGFFPGPESTPPAIQQLAPEVALFDSSHNPLGKKGVSLTGRMCQANEATPSSSLQSPPPVQPPVPLNPPHTGLTKWLVGD